MQSSIHTWIPCSVVELLSYSRTFIFLRSHYKFIAKCIKNINNTMNFMIYCRSYTKPVTSTLHCWLTDQIPQSHKCCLLNCNNRASPRCILGTYFGIITLTNSLKVSTYLVKNKEKITPQAWVSHKARRKELVAQNFLWFLPKRSVKIQVTLDSFFIAQMA